MKFVIKNFDNLKCHFISNFKSLQNVFMVGNAHFSQGDIAPGIVFANLLLYVEY